ncbi:MAG: hypothetical protein AB1763_09530 [Campylobacterota bacterium]
MPPPCDLGQTMRPNPVIAQDVAAPGLLHQLADAVLVRVVDSELSPVRPAHFLDVGLAPRDRTPGEQLNRQKRNKEE